MLHTEHLTDWRSPDLLIDHADRLVRNVALAAPDSRNGYRYSESALRDAVPLYAHKPVFLDHAPHAAQPLARSTRDLVGHIINPRFQEGRIRGDIRTLPTEAGQIFLALAEHNAPAVGMSHVVLAERNADRTLVEKILDVVSVDAVAFPAATASLRESQHSPPHPPPIETLQEELAQLRTARDHLQQQLTRAQHTLAAHAEVDRLLQDTPLPPHALTPAFRTQLLEARDEAHRRLLLTDRLQLLQAAPFSTPHSRERPTPTHLTPDDDRALIRALKRHHQTTRH